jgi:hypothetical protein
MYVGRAEHFGYVHEQAREPAIHEGENFVSGRFLALYMYCRFTCYVQRRQRVACIAFAAFGPAVCCTTAHHYLLAAMNHGSDAVASSF